MGKLQPAFQTFWGKFGIDAAAKAFHAADHQPRAEATLLRRRGMRTAALDPIDREIGIVGAPGNLDPALRTRQRAVLDRIGDEFVEHERQIARRIRRQLDVAAFQARAKLPEWLELRPDQCVQIRLQIGGVADDIIGRGHGADAAGDDLRGVRIMSERLQHDRFHHRERILCRDGRVRAPSGSCAFPGIRWRATNCLWASAITMMIAQASREQSAIQKFKAGHRARRTEQPALHKN